MEWLPLAVYIGAHFLGYLADPTGKNTVLLHSHTYRNAEAVDAIPKCF